MLKLAILLIAALAAPCIVNAQISASYWFGISTLYTSNNGFQSCGLTSPDWANVFLSRNINIQSTFSDAFGNSAYPTVQSSVKIRFNFPFVGSDEYYIANPNLPLPSTLISGSSGYWWLQVIPGGNNQIIFLDQSTGSTILLTNFGGYFTLYFFTNTNYLNSGSGIFVKGCPNAFKPGYTPYSANVNLGRRKRGIEECQKIANSLSPTSSLSRTSIANVKGFDSDSISSLCKNSFTDVISRQKVDLTDAISSNLKAAQTAVDQHYKNFPEGFVPKTPKDAPSNASVKV